MMDFPDHPFWDFSLALYGRPDVADACLRLQDECDLDVNLLLFACWRGAVGGVRLSAAEWHRLIDGTEDWRRRVVEPLRAVRRHLKGLESPEQAAVLHKRVMGLELDAEHAEQLAIVTLAGQTVGGSPDQATVHANLEAYAAAVGVVLTDNNRWDLAVLAGQALSIGKNVIG